MGIKDLTYKQSMDNVNNAIKVLEQKTIETSDESYTEELKTAKKKLEEVKQKIIQEHQGSQEYFMLTNVEFSKEDCKRIEGFMFKGNYVIITWHMSISRHEETFTVYQKTA